MYTMNTVIADIRRDYRLKSLNEKDVAVNPVDQFATWWQEAAESNIDEVNAMTLATATKAGKPSARIVLLKGFDNNGFTFFTNYNSHKGVEIAENPYVSLVFFWKELERQVRIEGIAEKTAPDVSEAYFLSRPAASRVGAWSSPQSSVIENRKVLEKNEAAFKKQFGDNIPRPPHWGGYIVKPVLIEFWQGRASRLHDRLQYALQEKGNWALERLAP